MKLPHAQPTFFPVYSFFFFLCDDTGEEFIKTTIKVRERRKKKSDIQW